MENGTKFDHTFYRQLISEGVPPLLAAQQATAKTADQLEFERLQGYEIDARDAAEALEEIRKAERMYGSGR